MIQKTHSRYYHLKYLLESLKSAKGEMLDVGCGSGWLLNEIKGRFLKLKITGCDIKKYEKYKFHFKLSKAEKLNFPDSKFDFVLMTDVLEHLKKPATAIAEISRVLKSNGKFHLAVPLEGELYTIDGVMRKVFDINQKKGPIGHIQQFTLKKIELLLATNKFKIIKIRYSYHFLYQALSFFYFTNLNISNKGKYKPLNVKQKLIDFIGFFVNLEDYFFSRIKGQEAHIYAVKEN